MIGTSGLTSNAAMNAPHPRRQAHLFERLMPGQYMLINAVDECAVKIEEESQAMRRMLSHGYEILPSGKSYLQEMGLAALDAVARPGTYAVAWLLASSEVTLSPSTSIGMARRLPGCSGTEIVISSTPL